MPYEWRYLNCTFPGAELFRAIEELRFARWKESIDPNQNETLKLEPKVKILIEKNINFNYFSCALNSQKHIIKTQLMNGSIKICIIVRIV